MVTKAGSGRRIAVAVAVTALCASSLATALTTSASAVPAVAAVTTDSPEDPTQEISRLIVSYEKGVSPVTPGGEATGSGAVPGVELSPGDPLGAGMRTVELGEAVSEETAEQIAARLARDPRVAWAEPDRFLELAADPVKDAEPPLEVATACTESSLVEPIARCYDDDNLDAGLSLDAEIIWADAYVAAAAPTRLVIDIVPYVAIRNDAWLLQSDVSMSTEIDLNSDDIADLSLRPVPASLATGQTTPLTIYDYDTASTRGDSCGGVLTRRTGTHRALPGITYSWWEMSIGWSCLVGSASANVRLMTRTADYLWPGSDFAPDAFDDQTPIDFGILGSTPPSAPTSVSATPAPAGLGISWSAPGTPPTPASYTARAYDDSIGGTQRATCTTTTTSCALTSLTPGTTYWIDVISTNFLGNSAPSAPRVQAVPGAAQAPGAPQSLQARTSSQQIRLTWSAPTSNGGSAVTGYTAELYAAPTGGAPLDVCNTSSLTCTFTSLTNSVTYYASVSASNVVGAGTATSRMAATPRAEFQPDDPYYTSSQMWGLNGTYGVQAPSAWTLTRGAPEIVVAVLDTGSTTHPDLVDQTVAGYDMIEDVATANDGTGRDADPADPGDWTSSRNSSWHGTHVAGTINAIGNNGIGVVGVAPDVKVQHVRVLGTGGGWTSDITAGITWASGGTVPGVPVNQNPSRVINMSLGGSGGCGYATQTAISDARSRGTVVVVAAGNSNGDASNFTPANCPGVITVAATASTGARASFSNYGSTVEIAAPGSGIWSTLNQGSRGPGAASYADYSGTSMASPHVAGVVALMLSRNPALTAAQVEDLIANAAQATAFPGGVCDSATPSKTCGVGLINAAALLRAVRPATSVTSFAPSSGPASGGTSVLITGQGFTGATAVRFGPDAATSFTVIDDTQITATAPARTPSSVTLSVTTADGTANSTGSFQYLPTVPAAPTSVLAAALPGSARVAWQAPAYTGGVPITGYTVTAAPDGATCTTTDLACTVPGLTDGSAYTFTVVATNSVGTSVASGASASVTPSASAPSLTLSSAPLSVTATRAASSAVIAWQAPSASGFFPVTHYRATATPGGSTCQVAAPALTCTVPNLINGATYTIDVVALTGAGWGASASATVTPAAAPAAPAAPGVAAGDGAVTVTWSAPDDSGGLSLTGYVVQVATSPTGSFSTAAGACASPGLATSCVASSLGNGTTYYFRVAGVNDVGTGTPSSVSNAVTPTAPYVPPPPPPGGGGGGGGGGGAPPPAPSPSPSASASPSPSPSPSPTPEPSPSPVPAPVLPPGETQGLVGGQPDPNLRTEATGGQLLVSGSGYAVSLGATSASGVSQQVARDGVLRVPTGGALQLGGSGFAPSGSVDVFLDPPTTGALAYAIARLLPRSSYSLGRVSVGADGAISGSIELPATTPPGDRVLQLVGRTSDDRALVLSLGIEVAESVPPSLLIGATRGSGRQKQVVILTGSSTGLVGRSVTVRMSNSGQLGYTNHSTRPMVRGDGSFTWRIRSSSAMRIFVNVLVDGTRVRSNAVFVRALR